MNRLRTLVGTLLVAGLAFLSGGWLVGHNERAAEFSAQLFREVLQHVRDEYVDPYSEDRLYRMAADGLLRELGDPHTALMSPEEYENLRLQTTGEYGGLGIQIALRDGWVTVIAPLPNTPAARAGIQPGDRIVEVNGQSTRGWTEDQAVRALRGPKGTTVRIKVVRVGVDEPIEFTIVRDEIHIDSVSAAYLLDPAAGVGYVRLTTFAETSKDELVRAIERLRGQGMRKLVLDLRLNPGGLFDQAIAISDLFLREGQTIVQMRARDPSESRTFRARGDAVLPDAPLVVLAPWLSGGEPSARARCKAWCRYPAGTSSSSPRASGTPPWAGPFRKIESRPATATRRAPCPRGTRCRASRTARTAGGSSTAGAGSCRTSRCAPIQ